MKCTYCGKENADTAGFCVNCGSQFRQEPVYGATTVLNNPEQTTYQPAGNPSYQNQAYSSNNNYNNSYNANPQPAGYTQQGEAYMQQGDAYAAPPQMLGEKEFFKRYASKGTKGLGIALGVLSLVSGAVCLTPLVFGNFFVIIDMVFYITFGCLLLTVKKWGLPLTVVIYCGIATVLNVLISGIPGGVAMIVIGIIYIIKLKKENDAYKLYKRTGQLPQAFI